MITHIRGGVFTFKRGSGNGGCDFRNWSSPRRYPTGILTRGITRNTSGRRRRPQTARSTLAKGNEFFRDLRREPRVCADERRK